MPAFLPLMLALLNVISTACGPAQQPAGTGPTPGASGTGPTQGASEPAAQAPAAPTASMLPAGKVGPALDPATGASRTLLAAPSGGQGVIVAVPSPGSWQLKTR